MPWSPIPAYGRNPTVWDETGGLGPPAHRAYASERNVAYGGDVDPPRNQEGGSGNPPDLIQKHACHGALPFCRDPENNILDIGNRQICLFISQHHNIRQIRLRING